MSNPRKASGLFGDVLLFLKTGNKSISSDTKSGETGAVPGLFSKPMLSSKRYQHIKVKQ